MTPERHARAEEIFQAALELPRACRSRYLDEACAGDAELRAYLQRLLDACTQTFHDDDGNSVPTVTLCVKECPHCKRCYDHPVAFCPADGHTLTIAFPATAVSCTAR